jgi:thymidylate kinase
MIPRRTVFTVALVGADGAGKSTIGRRLISSLPFPAKYLYMGDNLTTANKMLPTTRLLWWIRRARGITPRSGPPTARPEERDVQSSGDVGSFLKTTLKLMNRLSEEYYRVALAWLYQLRGSVVVFDRHYFADYYACDIAANGNSQSWNRRLHGFILDRFFPRPDLVVCLDAPAEVLFARKPEGTVEALERRRQEYFRIRDAVERFVVVDASQDADQVARDVSGAIEDYWRGRSPRRNGKKVE